MEHGNASDHLARLALYGAAVLIEHRNGEYVVTVADPWRKYYATAPTVEEALFYVSKPSLWGNIAGVVFFNMQTPVVAAA
jgi:hypothetical protein